MSFQKQVLCLWTTIVIYFILVFLISSYYIPHHSIPFQTNSNPTPHNHITTPSNIKIPFKQQKWGSIYSPIRIFCLVPTLIPQNNKNIEAILETWGITCDNLYFIINNPISSNKIENEKKLFISKNNNVTYNYNILKLPIIYNQNKKERNIWEKMWKTWKYFGENYLMNGEYFLKIDDDSFFSGINFKGFARYYNPDGYWYMGHTLLHKWRRDNVVFNSGTAYAISRGSLGKVFKVFQSQVFLNPLPNIANQTLQGIYCVPRKGPLEDQSMGVCMRSLGIQPTNTLDNQLRQRFHMFKDTDMLKVIHEDTWFWKYKISNIGVGKNCCSPNTINFHAFKGGDIYGDMKKLHDIYNIEEGVNGKIFEIPYIENENNQQEFWYKHGKLDFKIDQYWNKIDPPIGQRVYKGKGKERTCFKCELAHLVY